MNGYWRDFYSAAERTRKAQERLAAIETARYCREVQASSNSSDEAKSSAGELLAKTEAAIFGGKA